MCVRRVRVRVCACALWFGLLWQASRPISAAPTSSSCLRPPVSFPWPAPYPPCLEPQHLTLPPYVPPRPLPPGCPSCAVHACIRLPLRGPPLRPQPHQRAQGQPRFRGGEAAHQRGGGGRLCGGNGRGSGAGGLQEDLGIWEDVGRGRVRWAAQGAGGGACVCVFASMHEGVHVFVCAYVLVCVRTCMLARACARACVCVLLQGLATAGGGLGTVCSCDARCGFSVSRAGWSNQEGFPRATCIRIAAVPGSTCND